MTVELAPELARYIAERSQILAEVRSLLVEDLRVRREPDEIDPDTPLFGTGLGLDSVDALDLVIGIETRFALKFPNDGRGRAALRTVNGLVELVLRHRAAGAAA